MLLLKIAHPLVDESTSQIILDQVEASENLISGIKACTNYILNKNKIQVECSVFILSGTIQPMDLVTHLPALCEEHNIPYVWVDNTKWIGNKTCVILTNINKENYEKITAWYTKFQKNLRLE